MSRFVDVRGKRINMDTVAQYWRTPNGTIYIEFTNGESENVPYSDFQMEQLDGEDFVVQVVPVTEPIYHVWKDEDNQYWATPVHYLGVCADGVVKALDNVGGYFEATIDADGIYYKCQLSQYPGIRIDDGTDEGEVV